MNKSIHFVLQIDVGCAKYGEKNPYFKFMRQQEKSKMDNTSKEKNLIYII